MATIREQLTGEAFTDQEAEAIFRRAAALQSQAEHLETRLPRVVVDESAAAVGSPREYVEQAIQQLEAERTARLARRAARRWMGRAIAIGATVCLMLAAFISHRAFNTRLADVEATQAQLDNVLQRRHDLIPNLIAAAKAPATQEKDLTDSLGTLYKELPRARSRAQKQVLEAQLGDAVTRLMTMLRADPEAASTAVFSRLSDEMAGAENRIAVERKRYNDAVAAYNRTAVAFRRSCCGRCWAFPGSTSIFTSLKRRSGPRPSDAAHLATQRRQPRHAGASPASDLARSREGRSGPQSTIAGPMERKLAAILSADVQADSHLIGEDEEATVRALTAYRSEWCRGSSRAPGRSR